MTTDQPPFALPSELSIYQAAELKSQWLAAMPPGGDWTVDASAVESVDLAGIQVLLLMQREMGAAGRALKLHGISAELRSVITLLGLAGLLAEAS